MRVDLSLDETLPTQVAMLLGMLQDAVNRVETEVRDMEPEELHFQGDRRRDPSPAALLHHLAGSNLSYAAHCFGADIPPDFQQLFKPSRDEEGRLVEPSAVRLEELLQRLHRSVDFLTRGLKALNEADLDRTIPMGGDREATLRWCAWHAAAHHIHHLAHIRTLRRRWRETGKS